MSFKYLPNMEQLDHTMLNQFLEEVARVDFDKFTAVDVREALKKDYLELTPQDFAVLLSPVAADFLEEMAQKAQIETRKRFGNTVCLYTPLYIANYCANNCIYCGYNCKNKIHRGSLSYEEIEDELKSISATGLQEILLLTGEHRVKSSVEFIAEACRIARKYFTTVGIEVYPMNSDEYRVLHEAGADFVSVYQETYNTEKYDEVHLSGPKKVYPYRFYAQERALMGGMRGVGFGALLGLDDFRKDAFATGLHAYMVQKKYPHAEVSFSCPRLRPIVNDDTINPKDVHERQLLQIMCAYRLFMPFAGINISTRECARFRNNAINICATKISAGVKTSVGGHGEEEKGDAQFIISDERSVDEILEKIQSLGLQSAMTDYLYV